MIEIELLNQPCVEINFKVEPTDVNEVNLQDVYKTIESNEKVTAAALNDLNNKIAEVAESVIGALNTEV